MTQALHRAQKSMVHKNAFPHRASLPHFISSSLRADYIFFFFFWVQLSFFFHCIWMSWGRSVRTAHNLIKLALGIYSIVSWGCFSCRKKTALTIQESVFTLLTYLLIHLFSTCNAQKFICPTSFQLYLHILFARNTYSYTWLSCECFSSFSVLDHQFHLQAMNTA